MQVELESNFLHGAEL